MSTYQTLLSVANLGVEAAQLNELERARRQGEAQVAEEQLRQQILASIRSDIFRFKQAADAALEVRVEQPRVAAGAMAVLARQLDRSGITPDLFPELSTPLQNLP